MYNTYTQNKKRRCYYPIFLRGTADIVLLHFRHLFSLFHWHFECFSFLPWRNDSPDYYCFIWIADLILWALRILPLPFILSEIIKFVISSRIASKRTYFLLNKRFILRSFWESWKFENCCSCGYVSSVGWRYCCIKKLFFEYYFRSFYIERCVIFNKYNLIHFAIHNSIHLCFPKTGRNVVN